MLADERRRFVLYDLVRHIHPVAVYDLTDRLLAWEADERVPDESFDGVRRALLDEHLPQLAVVGLVESSADGERHLPTERGMAVEADGRGLRSVVGDDSVEPRTSN